VIDDTVNLM